MPLGVVANTFIEDTGADGGAAASYAFVDSMAGTTATMQQPLSAASYTTVAVAPAATENNAWATGDVMKAWALPTVNLKEWRPSGGDVTNAGVPSVGWIQWVIIADGSAGAGTAEFPLVNDAASTVLSGCVVLPRLHTSALQGRGQGINTVGTSMMSAVLNLAGSALFAGGGMASTVGLWGSPAQQALSADIIIHGNQTVTGTGVLYANVYSAGATTVWGTLDMTGSLWGPGNVTVPQGGIFLNTSGTWTGSTGASGTGLLLSGTLTLLYQGAARTTACSFNYATSLYSCDAGTLSAINVTNLDLFDGGMVAPGAMNGFVK
jgi:hypothetical protein